MQNLSIKLFVLLFPLIPLYPFYVGNPGSPGIMKSGFFTNRNPWFKITTGYIADYTSNKRYVASQTDPNFDPNDTFRQFGLHSQLGSVSLVLLERIELMGTLGGTKERVKSFDQPLSNNPLALYFDFKSSHSFSWSAGLKVILLQWGQTFLSTDFSFFEVPEASSSYFQFFQQYSSSAEAAKQHFTMREWQASIGLASRFWFLTPYGGANYLRSRMHMENGPSVPATTYHNKERIGYFYGITISLGPKLFANFERRVRNEFGYTFSTVAVF